jgi:hypothetical protein
VTAAGWRAIEELCLLLRSGAVRCWVRRPGDPLRLMEPTEFPEPERWSGWHDGADWQCWVLSKAALMKALPPRASVADQRFAWIRGLGRRPTLAEVRKVAKERGWPVVECLAHFGEEADALNFPPRKRGERLQRA